MVNALLLWLLSLKQIDDVNHFPRRSPVTHSHS